MGFGVQGSGLCLVTLLVRGLEAIETAAGRDGRWCVTAQHPWGSPVCQLAGERAPQALALAHPGGGPMGLGFLHCSSQGLALTLQLSSLGA